MIRREEVIEQESCVAADELCHGYCPCAWRLRLAVGDNNHDNGANAAQQCNDHNATITISYGFCLNETTVWRDAHLHSDQHAQCL